MTAMTGHFTFIGAAFLFCFAFLMPSTVAVAREEKAGSDEDRTGARAFLEEVYEKYMLPNRGGLESFSLSATLHATGSPWFDRLKDNVALHYDWQAPDREDLRLEGVPKQGRRMIRDALAGLWMDIAGGCAFPGLDQEGLALERGEVGVVLTVFSEDRDPLIRALFDPVTRLALQIDRRNGNREITVIPTFAVKEGLFRFEGKTVSLPGQPSSGEGSFSYGGFREIDGFVLPTLLTVNTGKAELEFGFEYETINGKEAGKALVDVEMVKALVKEYEKNYSKWSSPQKLGAMQNLMETGHELAAAAIAKKGLKDKDLHVREEAAKALGRMGCRKELGSLTKALKPNDRNQRVYLAIIEALGDMGDPKAVPFLSKDFWNQKETGTGIKIAQAKIDALGRIRSKKSVDALIDMLYIAGRGAMRQIMPQLVKSLRKLTDQDFDRDRNAWKGWWKKNKSKFKLEEDK